MDLNSRWTVAAFYRTAVCGLAKTAASKTSLAGKPGGVSRGQKDSADKTPCREGLIPNIVVASTMLSLRV
jgi:hypothetical protein